MGARHFQKMAPEKVRVRTPCYTLNKEVVALVKEVAQKYDQTPSRIIQAAIRYKTSELRGRYKGIRYAFECFKNYEEPLPPPPQTKYITPPLFDDLEVRDEV